MIIVNGIEYRTLNDELMVNGRKVYKAYANGELVYPEPYDSRYTYIVATGEWDGDLSETSADNAWSEKIGTKVSAKVTWILRLMGGSASIDDSGSSIYVKVNDIFNPNNTMNAGELVECWTIVDLDVSDSNAGFYDHTNYSNGGIYDRYEVNSQGAATQTSGTYAFRRPIAGSSTINLLNYGDLGFSSKPGRFGWGRPFTDGTQYPFEAIPALQVYFRETSNSTADVSLRLDSGTSLSVTFNDIFIVIGNAVRQKLLEVYVRAYIESDTPRIRHEEQWIDVESDRSERIDKYGHVMYSNSDGVVRRYGYNDQAAFPQLYEMRRLFKVRADKVNVYMPGDELPEEAVDIGSVDYYDSRELHF